MTCTLSPATLEALTGIVLLTSFVMGLVALVLIARALLLPRGEVAIAVNGRTLGRAACGGRLLDELVRGGVGVPSACGGTGTCGLCRVDVLAGGGAVLPTEAAVLSRREIARGTRLACQVVLRGDVEVTVPDELLGVQELTCTVRSNRSVASFMKELVLDLPAGARLEFRAGAFVQVHCPPYEARFSDFELPDEIRAEWARLGLDRLTARNTVPTTRAYSLANHPGEEGIAQLVVRIATPPPDVGPDVPPGVVSSYVFSLRPGDPVTISGPYAGFAAHQSDREMVFVAGGAGMAPMRAHILDQLAGKRTGRTISFWYGARSRRELFYDDLFDRLAAEHPNFTWHVALSQPLPGDDWHGPVGYIHRVLEERLLRTHPCPEDCEYYLCGPPLMIAATRELLHEYGVPGEHVLCDDFGDQAAAKRREG